MDAKGLNIDDPSCHVNNSLYFGKASPCHKA